MKDEKNTINDDRKKLNELGYSDEKLKKILELMKVESKLNELVDTTEKLSKLYEKGKIKIEDIEKIVDDFLIKVDKILPKRKPKTNKTKTENLDFKEEQNTNDEKIENAEENKNF
jgi:hypothetical protein